MMTERDIEDKELRKKLWAIFGALTDKDDGRGTVNYFFDDLIPFINTYVNEALNVRQSDEIRELLCQLCYQDYPTWFAPNEIWNRVMRHPDGRESSEKYHFVCPTCFANQADVLGIQHGVWMLSEGEL